MLRSILAIYHIKETFFYSSTKVIVFFIDLKRISYCLQKQFSTSLLLNFLYPILIITNSIKLFEWQLDILLATLLLSGQYPVGSIIVNNGKLALAPNAPYMYVCGWNTCTFQFNSLFHFRLNWPIQEGGGVGSGGSGADGGPGSDEKFIWNLCSPQARVCVSVCVFVCVCVCVCVCVYTSGRLTIEGNQ